jgi:hypothetical protein
MKGIWVGSLGVALGIFVCGLSAQEYQWRPATSASACAPAAVTLGKPVAWDGAARADYQEMPVSTSPVTLALPRPVVVRAQAADPLFPATPAAPPLPPPVPPVPPSGPFPGMPVTPNEQFNCGVVTEPPGTANPFWKGCQNLWGGCKHLASDVGTCEGGRSPFQSDIGFNVFSSPITNPFLFEDPRALTEVRPIFMWQGTPTSNPIFHGGDIVFAGFQARLALTQRLSVVMNELGAIWMEPHNPVGDFATHSGISELRIGPKYTFYRCEESGCVAAAGLTFDIPIGPHKVFQDTGSLSLEPYVSVGKNFGASAYGSFNFLGTIGYSVAADSQRTDFLFTSLHLDYDVGRLHIIYPMIELNYFYYASSGSVQPVNFEGRDLFNFGATSVSGHNSTSMAIGARYKFNECWQAGLAYEFPLSGKDLMDFRITADVIYRF